MYKKLIGVLTIFSMVLALGIINGSQGTQVVEPLGKRDKGIIRFHLIANSDSPEDQELKLKARDKILDFIGDELKNSSDIRETREILSRNIPVIEEITQDEIFKNDKDYKVVAELREDVFPTKSYGPIVFPSGRYEALKVTIGEGKGQNWWCVMFPPLCFIDVKNGLVDNETQNKLKENLTEEEYKLIFKSSNAEELPIQLKSKLAELFKASRKQFDRIVAKF